MIVCVQELKAIQDDLAQQQWLMDNGLTLDEIDAVVEFQNEMI